MRVEIGNADAIEGYYEEVEPTPVLQEDGSVIIEEAKVVLKYRDHPGEQVTTFLFPETDDFADLNSVIQAVIISLPSHMRPNSRPWWIESDNEAVKVILCAHYGVDPKKRKPPRWGDGSTTTPSETTTAKTRKKAQQ